MLINARLVRRAVVGAIGTGAVAGTLLVAAAPAALADPPNCTAADLAGIVGGVSAATSAYLDANPTVRSDLEGIRQPLVDQKNRCGISVAPTP
jgi:hypothetical protein